MKLYKNNLNKRHLKSFLWIYGVFTILIAIVAYTGLDRDDGHTVLVIKSTACSVTGAMVCAISRAFQPCCLEFSLSVIKIAASLLLLGIIPQFINAPDKKPIRIIRGGFWIFGWFAWFFLGLISMIHAIS